MDLKLKDWFKGTDEEMIGIWIYLTGIWPTILRQHLVW